MNVKKRILFLGTVFPEPTSSAAGIRTMALVEDFLSRGDTVAFISPSDANGFSKALEEKSIQTAQIKANDPAFDSWVKAFDPDVVVFDRFILEEQFGWRVAEHAPRALRVLDTSDLHFLRRARGDGLASELRRLRSPEGASIPQDVFDRLHSSLEGIETADCDRELASIHRSDLTLVISPFEESLLVHRLGVPSEFLLGLGFSYDPGKPGSFPESERKHFVSIGNFRHPPNRDSAFWMARVLWPRIRERLAERGFPGVELHLYGAYPPKEIMELDRSSPGFRVFGPVADSREMLDRYQLLFAPLRFGAGIKGKIADAWSVDLPVLTTPIGAEGMVAMGAGTDEFAGWVERSEDALVERAVSAYLDPESRREKAELGRSALATLYSVEKNRAAFLGRIDELLRPGELSARRAKNRWGRILLADWSGRTKYLSKWIEEKNKREALQKELDERNRG